jgi:cytochrome c oxidase assembly factor CtaG/polyferredoxin
LLAAGVYWHGWRALRRRDPQRWSRGRPAAFAAALATLYFALAGPPDAFAPWLLQAHMAQHMLLTMAVPPLIWLAWPALPLLRGVPLPLRRYWIGPVWRWRPLRRLCAAVTHPLVAAGVLTATTWLWHWPALYGLALRDEGWHVVQHASFSAAGLAFWYAVVLPYPARPDGSRWLILPALLLADVQNTVLAATLTFSDRIIYLHYAQSPRLGVAPLADQAAAGVLMWVPGSVAYLIPFAMICMTLLTARPRPVPDARRVSLPLLTSGHRADVLATPVLGRLLRLPLARTVVQTVLLALAAAVIVDGLTGPSVSPMNLAGVLPWIHWRGALILGLLLAGNAFCFGCPFMLPRAVVRRLVAPGWDWPRRLRNKWLACALVIAFLWSYEAFSLWDRPASTAWLTVGYFIGAAVIDGTFRGASFCKYVCPVGQFNFVQSLMSPAGVSVRDRGVCSSCATHDCVRGRAGSPPVRGCELRLYVPGKTNNMDCTLCLDCVRACPHDNVGLPVSWPGAGVASAAQQWGGRRDLAALSLILVFGAFANAGGMVGPVLAIHEQARDRLGLASAFLPVTLFYLGSVVALPLAVVSACSRPALTLCLATIPLGFAMWLCHYCFHLATSFDTIIPVVQRGLGSWGFASVEPDWVQSCCRPAGAWLPRWEILALGVGLLTSLFLVSRLHRASADISRRARGGFAALLVALYGVGVWIVLQPMQMRGTLGPG